MYFFHPRWPVFYEDNHVLVLYKPAGLIIQRDHRNKANLLDMAKAWIKARHNKPGQAFAGLVHRLDGPVAGLVVLGRTSKGASRLSAQFRQGTIEKGYLAVVEGRPVPAEGRLEQYLVREGRLSALVPADTPESQKARLSFKTINTHKGKSLVRIDLKTGRRHQIRVQMAGLGCPIVGDVNYGAREHLAHGRIALLAQRLAFDHPTRNQRMHFETSAPLGWPWTDISGSAPLWTIEEFYADGLNLTAP